MRKRALARKQAANCHCAGANQLSELVGELSCHRFDTFPVDSNFESHSIVLRVLGGAYSSESLIECQTIEDLIHTPFLKRGVNEMQNRSTLICQGFSAPCLRRISSVRSIGKASTVWPRPVVVVARNSEL